MSSVNIKHFKLTNNDEIVCEVLEWDTGDDITDIVVSKALRVVALEDFYRGFKFFCFRPWLSFQDDPSSLQTINSSHIVVSSNPTPDILKHYKACLRAIAHELNNKGKSKSRTTYANLDEINDAIRDMTDDEMDLFLEKKYGMKPEKPINPTSNDSDLGDNILQFRPKGDKTIH